MSMFPLCARRTWALMKLKAPSATKTHEQEITYLPTCSSAPEVGCANHAKAEGASDRDSYGSNCATSASLLSVPSTADTEERNANFRTLCAVLLSVAVFSGHHCFMCDHLCAVIDKVPLSQNRLLREEEVPRVRRKST